MTATLLVTGASGHLGQRVLHHLLDTLNTPAKHIIATTRKPELLSSWATRGITVRAADFDDKLSLMQSFQGANRVLVISTDVDAPGHRLQQHLNAIEIAEKMGVSHLTYTSMPEPKNSLVQFAPDHAETEEALSRSALAGWTVLRNHWYFENTFMTLPAVMAQGGIWFSAAGQGKLADIARDDLALAAAHELSTFSTGKNTYTLSGAEALTTLEQAQQISTVIGKPIDVIPVSNEDLFNAMVGNGVPEHVAQLLASFDENAAAGHMAKVSSDFEKITGRKPRLFADWLTENREVLAAF